MTIQEKTAITFFVLGLVLILVSLPLYLGKVKRNRLYGFRIPKAFESEENWYRINRYGAKVLILWTLVLMMVAVSCLYVRPEYVTTLANIGFLSIVIPIVQTIHFARKL
jgi:uncharacterized membrane protein